MKTGIHSGNSIRIIARHALLDSQYCQNLLQASSLQINVNQIDHDITLWIQSLRKMDKEELNLALWRAATMGQPSTWQALQRMLRAHLTAVRKLMICILEEMPGDSTYRNAIATIVRKGKAAVMRTPSSVLWSLAVMHSQTGTISPEIYPLAAACAFYYQGVALLDDVADGESGPYYAGWPQGQAEHIALSMAGALPLACIKRLNCSNAVIQKITDDFTQAMWLTNNGQFLDIGGYGLVSTGTFMAEKILLYKAGIGYAHLARASAHYFQLADRDVDDWEKVTEIFDIARQIASDVFDIWRKIPSTDLVCGKFTWPLAYAAECLPGDEINSFKELLLNCQYDLDARSDLYDLLNSLNILPKIEERLKEMKQSGMHILNRLNASPSAKRWVLTWASQASIFSDVSQE